jgi:6-phosphogluconolactonase
MVLEKTERMQANADVHVVQNETELIQNVYNILERTLDSCRKNKQAYCIVGLSGGSLIKTLAEVLPSLNEDYLSMMRFVFCDERRVPPDDQESTYGQYMKMVYPRLKDIVQKDRFLAIDHTLPVDQCAVNYERKLHDIVVNKEGDWPVLDVLLLGLGPDGHTCSLFPGHPVLKEQSRWVAPVRDSPKPPPERVTFTLPVLNHARTVVFVATGAAKADVLQKILEPSTSDEHSQHLPGAMIKPVDRSSRIHWILDKEAAAKIRTKNNN